MSRKHNKLKGGCPQTDQASKIVICVGISLSTLCSLLQHRKLLWTKFSKHDQGNLLRSSLKVMGLEQEACLQEKIEEKLKNKVLVVLP